MEDKFFTDSNHYTLTVFRLILTYVTFLNLPLFFIKEAATYRGLFVLLLTNAVYLCVFERRYIQIRLLLGLRHPLLPRYFSFVDKKTWYLNSVFRFLVFFFLLFTFYLLSKKHLIFFVLFMGTKFFWIFLILPRLLYWALFYSTEFSPYLVDLKKKCIESPLEMDLIARIEESFL